MLVKKKRKGKEREGEKGKRGRREGQEGGWGEERERDKYTSSILAHLNFAT